MRNTKLFLAATLSFIFMGCNPVVTIPNGTESGDDDTSIDIVIDPEWDGIDEHDLDKE